MQSGIHYLWYRCSSYRTTVIVVTKMSLLYLDQNVWKPNLTALFDEVVGQNVWQARSSKCQMPESESFNMMNFMSFVILTAHLIVSNANSANNNK